MFKFMIIEIMTESIISIAMIIGGVLLCEVISILWVISINIIIINLYYRYKKHILRYINRKINMNLHIKL